MVVELEAERSEQDIPVMGYKKKDIEGHKATEGFEGKDELLVLLSVSV